MSNLSIYCHTCTFWIWDENIVLDGKTYFPGHCGLYSGRCINAVADGHPLPPPDYMKIEIDEEL